MHSTCSVVFEHVDQCLHAFVSPFSKIIGLLQTLLSTANVDDIVKKQLIAANMQHICCMFAANILPCK